VGLLLVLHLSLWPYCLSKFFVSIVLIVMGLFPSLVNAQDSGFSPLILGNNEISYNTANHTAIIENVNNGYNIYDIANFQDAELVKFGNQGSDIRLSGEVNDYWFVLRVLNQTDLENWLLDFGGLETGNYGSLKTFFAYSSTEKKVVFNSSDDFLLNDRHVPLNIKPGTETTFLFKVTKDIYKNVSLSPSIIPDTAKSNQTKGIHAILVSYIPIVLVASLILLLLICYETKSNLFISFLFIYIVAFLWFVFIEQQTLMTYAGLEIIAVIQTPIIAIFVLCCSLFLLRELGAITMLHNALFLSLLGSVVIAIFLSFFEVLSSRIFYHILFNLSIFSMIISLLLLRNIKAPPAYISCFNYWLWVYVASIILSYLAKNALNTDNVFLINANYYSFYINTPIVFMICITALKFYKEVEIKKVSKSLQKAQSLMNAKNDKETHDQARLLRVIEREREVMEELRGRESQRTEEMRKAKMLADEANQAKSAFLAVVSHEIRTPMTGVMGMIHMLEDTDMTAEQKEYLMTIRDSGDAMLSLLNDILDFSKIEDGAMEIEHIEFDLQRVLNGVALLMKGHADQKNIEIKLDVHSDIPTKLYGDPTRLRQIVLNLVSNALKFTEKGHVAITASKVSEKDVSFAVQDTGIGISEAAQKNLFMPFSQADSSVSRKYGGTGLGLSICKKLVEVMGGNITVSSQEGRGTTFTFLLPLIEQAQLNSNEKRSEYKENQDVIASPLSVLVVDDNAINQLVLTSFLSKDKHTYTACSSGKEALALLEDDNSFDAVFLDIEMPEMNGRDVFKEIEKIEKLKHIPVIAVTGNVSEGDVKEYYDIGFYGVVAKPIDIKNIRSILLTIHQNHTVDEKQHRKGSLSKKSQGPLLGKTLDDDLLKGLKEGLGEKETRDLLDDLLKKADEIIDSLKAALKNNDLESVWMRGHEMKGMCANFGLKAVSQKAQEIEKIAKDEDVTIADINHHIEDMVTLMERSRIALDEFMKA
jgi:signal transduction histidine kinase/CheY-like chemotaxis protein/HPt (histidine-containing phosphotransfer) domain-containing protein